MKSLIVGLGNIGPQYLLNRHNVGFMVLDRLVRGFDTQFKMDRLAYYAETKHKGHQIYFIKPTTYMNLSGKALNYWLQNLKVEKENLLVVTDDIALPYGKIRIRPKGSHGGHNGLRNIEEILGNNEFARLRFGVGDAFMKGRQVEYVLGNFEGEEYDQLPEHLDKAGDAVVEFCTSGLQIAMNNFNQ
jgi:peptidyl-tRNA hydrolase, PTH1 family